MPLRGVSRPIAFMARSNFWRSSALSMASLLAPIILTPYFSRMPSRARSSAQFSAVCPPMVGSSASGRSFSMMLATELPVDRLDVGRIRHRRVGHDGRRVRVDQHHAEAFLAQRLAGLRAGVVELAGLTDHDRAGADDQDRMDVGAFWHGAGYPVSCATRTARSGTSISRAAAQRRACISSMK
jgi:hypothetical protein